MIGFRRHAKTCARLELGALAVSILIFLLIALTKDPNPPLEPPPGASCDRDVFERIIARVRAGDGFYDASQEELRTHGYPTRSVFNWRTPCYAWFLGAFPSIYCGQALLVAACVALLVFASSDMLGDHGIVGGAIGSILLVGALAWCVSNSIQVFTEFWAGVAIGLSICALRRGRVVAGVLAGLFALFYRELALPYVLVCFFLAIWWGRKREAIAWGLGIALFVVFMVVHASVVASRLTAVDQALEGGWIRLGGPRFVLATTGMNVFLMILPLWISALAVPFAILGLTRGRDESGVRVGLTGLAYLGAFCVVGAPFNYYWGFVDAPLLALGLAAAPRALWELIETSETVDLSRRAGAWRARCFSSSS